MLSFDVVACDGMLVGAWDGGGTSGGIDGIVSDCVGNDGIFVGAWDGGGTSGAIDGRVIV